jgi:hypothetical protein
MEITLDKGIKMDKEISMLSHETIDEMSQENLLGFAHTSYSQNIYQDGEITKLQQERAALKVELEAVKDKLISHERLAAKGIYYTEEELDYCILKWKEQAVRDLKITQNKIKADAIQDLITSRFTNVFIEGTEWPIIYVEDAHAYANQIEAGE